MAPYGLSIPQQSTNFLYLHSTFTTSQANKGPFKYYVIKEVGGWGQNVVILDDLQHCKSAISWVGGPKKVKHMMT